MAFSRSLHIVPSLLLLVVASSCMSQAFGDIAIIANDIGTKNLSEQEVKDAFKGKNNFWPNGQAVIICLPETKSSDAVPVCTAIYNKSVTDVQKFWLSQVFQGRGRPPKFTESDQEMIDYVRKNPGTIAAFINDSKLQVPQDLKIQIAKTTENNKK